MQANSSLLALATPREIQEMDISLLLESPSWLEDECEFDLVNLSRLVIHLYIYYIHEQTGSGCKNQIDPNIH